MFTRRPVDVAMTAHDFLVLRVLSNQKLIAVLCLLILGYMTVDDSEQPDILVGALVATLGQTVGSMTSFLTSTGPKREEPQAVEVVNTVDEPVPTEPQPPIDAVKK